MNAKSITFLIIFAGIVFAGGWYYKTKIVVPDEDMDMGVMAVESSRRVGAQTLVLLNQVNSLSLETDLFEDEFFLGLKEYLVIIPDQPTGRPNPFAPYIRTRNASSTYLRLPISD